MDLFHSRNKKKATALQKIEDTKRNLETFYFGVVDLDRYYAIVEKPKNKMVILFYDDEIKDYIEDTEEYDSIKYNKEKEGFEVSNNGLNGLIIFNNNNSKSFKKCYRVECKYSEIELLNSGNSEITFLLKKYDETNDLLLILNENSLEKASIFLVFENFQNYQCFTYLFIKYYVILLQEGVHILERNGYYIDNIKSNFYHGYYTSIIPDDIEEGYYLGGFICDGDYITNEGQLIKFSPEKKIIRGIYNGVLADMLQEKYKGNFLLKNNQNKLSVLVNYYELAEEFYLYEDYDDIYNGRFYLILTNNNEATVFLGDNEIFKFDSSKYSFFVIDDFKIKVTEKSTGINTFIELIDTYNDIYSVGWNLYGFGKLITNVFKAYEEDFVKGVKIFESYDFCYMYIKRFNRFIKLEADYLLGLDPITFELESPEIIKEFFKHSLGDVNVMDIDEKIFAFLTRNNFYCNIDCTINVNCKNLVKLYLTQEGELTIKFEVTGYKITFGREIFEVEDLKEYFQIYFKKHYRKHNKLFLYALEKIL